MSGVDFTRVPRDAAPEEGRWAEPWLVVWPTPGYTARTGIWRLRPGMAEEPLEIARERNGKRGYPLAEMEEGLYLIRTAHADQRGQHEHRLLWAEGKIEFVGLEQAIILLVRYG